ncbi:MAG: histidine--tRNA ligase, partial [Halanaerobium sp.]|nr:histidine--tRNA ligase [Halanaerobium sp.]
MKYYAAKGTQDILPPASARWEYIEEVARDLFHRYGFDEIRTPIFEHTDLFIRGVGEGTDIVEKEMYTFEDKGGRSLTLRPEGTAAVMRAFVEHKIYGQVQPTKLFYMGPMFRYEKPQAGRFRQHNQMGVELIGTEDPMADAEVISLGMGIIKALGLDDISVQVNSIGCRACRGDYLQDLTAYLREDEDALCQDCRARLERNPLRVLDCKVEGCQRVLDGAPVILDYLCDDCNDHFTALQGYLDEMGLRYEINPFLVRGLDYYTRTTFEVQEERIGAQSALFGGGRYDGLVEDIGGPHMPGIGFGMGVERVLLALEENGVELPIGPEIELFVATMGDRARKAAFSLVHKARQAGVWTEMDLLARSLKSQMKQADRKDALYTIILGENELDQGEVSLKNMQTGEQQQVAMDKIIATIQELI